MERPYGVNIPPGSVSVNAEAVQILSEGARLDRDREMINEMKNATRDLIGEQFGGRYYIQNHIFWMFQFRGRPIEVLRFYPDRNVAIDVYKEVGSDEEHEIAFKRLLFAENGIRYAALNWASDLTDLLPQIGLSQYGKSRKPDQEPTHASL